MARASIPAAPVRVLPFLIAANLGVFALWQLAIASGPSWTLFMQAHFLVSAESVFSGRIWTLLTSAFSHNMLVHLLFNLFALGTFGANVERVVGGRGFLHLYIAGAVLSSLGHLAYVFFTGSDVPALGASGSVFAIAVVAAMLWPNARVLVFFVVPMRLSLAVGAFVLLDLVGVLTPGPDPIAHGAHLGGALYGLLYHRYALRGFLEERLAALGLTLDGSNRRTRTTP